MSAWEATAFKAMASFHIISSSGLCRLERFEEGSVDLLENRYMFHKIGLLLLQVASASSFLKSNPERFMNSKSTIRDNELQ